MLSKKDTIDKFNSDINEIGQYGYTVDKLSCKFAHGRLTKACFEALDFNDKTVIDAGCGDGTYTREILKQLRNGKITAFDPSEKAIEKAKENDDAENSTYIVADIESFCPEQKQDIVVYRAVLHHIDTAKEAIAKALDWADTVLIIEPNGDSPILKLFEKLSKYHVEHGEKSYSYPQLKTWIEAAGGKVIYKTRVGCVPCFCPDFLARALKLIEPFVEKLPLINRLICSCNIIVYRKK